MVNMQRQHDAAFKARVAFEAAKGVFYPVVKSGGRSAFLLGPNTNMKPVSNMFFDGKKIPGGEEFFLIHAIIWSDEP